MSSCRSSASSSAALTSRAALCRHAGVGGHAGGRHLLRQFYPKCRQLPPGGLRGLLDGQGDQPLPPEKSGGSGAASAPALRGGPAAAGNPRRPEGTITAGASGSTADMALMVSPIKRARCSRGNGSLEGSWRGAPERCHRTEGLPQSFGVCRAGLTLG